MKVIIQRVLKSKVLINNTKCENINNGLMILLGFTYNDGIDDIRYLIRKILNIRIFEQNNKLNLNVRDVNGDILLIPQFTLYANPYDGNRPSFKDVLNKKDAQNLFNICKSEFIKEFPNIKFGEFGSDMKLYLVNDGPVTIIIDSKEKVKK